MFSLSQLSNTFHPFASLLTLVAVLSYGYFIMSDRLGAGIYMYIDLLVLILLLFNIYNSRSNNILFIVALVWLLGNYLLKVNKKSQICTGYDGFTLALLLNTFPMLQTM